MTSAPRLRNRLFALATAIALGLLLALAIAPAARADIDDDRYEGNIFALYAGNGGLVPPRVSLAEARRAGRPAMLVFYIDDSRDCKQFSPTVSRVQSFYARVLPVIATNADTLLPEREYAPDEAGYYYSGVVPQTVLLDSEGNITFDGVGQVEFEAIDDVLREMFDLLPRSESVELKRRSAPDGEAE